MPKLNDIDTSSLQKCNNDGKYIVLRILKV